MRVTLGRVLHKSVGVNDTDIRNALRLHESGHGCEFPSLKESVKGMFNDLLGGKGSIIRSEHKDRNGLRFEIVTYSAKGETWVIRLSR